MSAAPQQSPPVARATLAAVTGANDQVDTSTLVTVHFNPASLQLAVSNELKDTRNNERKQYIAKSSSKLTMDLIFDTTETGEDVMRTTRKLQAFLIPPTPPGQQAPREVPPPLVMFEWGTLRFKGVAEAYKETIDYFSPDGVPLRSSVNLTLSRQDKVFDDAGGGGASDSANDSLSLPGASSPAQTAAGAGAPGAARDIAASNGEESLRFSAGAGLTVSGGVQLRAAAAFSASAGAGIGGGIGGGLGLGAGASAGLSLGVGAGASLSAGASLDAGASVGLSARAGLSATEGAFSGLNTSASFGAGASASIDTDRLRTSLPGAKLSVDAGAAMSIGGSTGSDSPAGLRTNVGATEPLKLKITFSP